MNGQRRLQRLTVLAICLGLMVAPAAAESISELETLSRASAAPATGIDLARRQIAGGDLLDALATLERVLIKFPHAREAQLLRADVMCQLDDRAGSTVEFEQLRGRGTSDAQLRAAIAACDALTVRKAAQ